MVRLHKARFLSKLLAGRTRRPTERPESAPEPRADPAAGGPLPAGTQPADTAAPAFAELLARRSTRAEPDVRSREREAAELARAAAQDLEALETAERELRQAAGIVDAVRRALGVVTEDRDAAARRALQARARSEDSAAQARRARRAALAARLAHSGRTVDGLTQADAPDAPDAAGVEPMESDGEQRSDEMPAGAEPEEAPGPGPHARNGAADAFHAALSAAIEGPAGTESPAAAATPPVDSRANGGGRPNGETGGRSGSSGR